MNASDFIVAILSSATVSALLVSALFWLMKATISERLKHAIKAEYDEKLETHKSALKSQTDIELERLRSALSMAAAERNLTFSHLVEKRVGVIAETYKNLQAFHRAVAQYIQPFETSGMPSRADRLEIVREIFDEFDPQFRGSQIFLPRKLAQQVCKVKDTLLFINNKFAIVVDNPNVTQDSTAEWFKLTSRMESEVVEALEALESAMRHALGDVDDDTHPIAKKLDDTATSTAGG